MPGRSLLIVSIGLLLAGCAPRSPKLTFPSAPLSDSASSTDYDVNRNGHVDFRLIKDSSGRVVSLGYDDDEDGTSDRLYHLRDYDNDRVPHLVILLDSIPYQAMADRYSGGDFAWFDPPQKVIPPFPSLSEQIFSRILQCPPLPGVIDNAYDPRNGQFSSGIWNRVTGFHQPWEYRCHYVAKFYESGLSYLDPSDWYPAELARAKDALDQSPDRVTIVYFVSASGMLCKYSHQGLNDVLDGARRLCLQVLYERQGAVKISMCADHGHNMTPSTNVRFEPLLKHAGFNPTKKLVKPNDVVIDLNGLVTYIGMHTRRPGPVADAVLSSEQVELVTYLEGDRVVVRNQSGRATIERRGGAYRYTAIDDDVLGYAPVIGSLRAQGMIDPDGFIEDKYWFEATLNHQFPDAPHRLWTAFHGQVISPPDVMITMRDGFCAGDETFRKFIDMQSTHGGLNQVNSSTFLMTMTGRATKPLRSAEIFPTIEPGYELPVRQPK